MLLESSGNKSDIAWIRAAADWARYNPLAFSQEADASGIGRFEPVIVFGSQEQLVSQLHRVRLMQLAASGVHSNSASGLLNPDLQALVQSVARWCLRRPFALDPAENGPSYPCLTSKDGKLATATAGILLGVSGLVQSNYTVPNAAKSQIHSIRALYRQQFVQRCDDYDHAIRADSPTASGRDASAAGAPAPTRKGPLFHSNFVGFGTRMALAGQNEYFCTGLAGFFDDAAACARSSQAQAVTRTRTRSIHSSAHGDGGPVSGAWAKAKPDAQNSLADAGSSSRVFLEMTHGQAGIQLREQARYGLSHSADPTPQPEVRHLFYSSSPASRKYDGDSASVSLLPHGPASEPFQHSDFDRHASDQKHTESSYGQQSAYHVARWMKEVYHANSILSHVDQYLIDDEQNIIELRLHERGVGWCPDAYNAACPCVHDVPSRDDFCLCLSDCTRVVVPVLVWFFIACAVLLHDIPKSCVQSGARHFAARSGHPSIRIAYEHNQSEALESLQASLGYCGLNRNEIGWNGSLARLATIGEDLDRHRVAPRLWLNMISVAFYYIGIFGAGLYFNSNACNRGTRQTTSMSVLERAQRDNLVADLAIHADRVEKIQSKGGQSACASQLAVEYSCFATVVHHTSFWAAVAGSVWDRAARNAVTGGDIVGDYPTLQEIKQTSAFANILLVASVFIFFVALGIVAAQFVFGVMGRREGPGLQHVSPFGAVTSVSKYAVLGMLLYFLVVGFVLKIYGNYDTFGTADNGKIRVATIIVVCLVIASQLWWVVRRVLWCTRLMQIAEWPALPSVFALASTKTSAWFASLHVVILLAWVGVLRGVSMAPIGSFIAKPAFITPLLCLLGIYVGVQVIAVPHLWTFAVSCLLRCIPMASQQQVVTACPCLRSKRHVLLDQLNARRATMVVLLAGSVDRARQAIIGHQGGSDRPMLRGFSHEHRLRVATLVWSADHGRLAPEYCIRKYIGHDEQIIRSHACTYRIISRSPRRRRYGSDRLVLAYEAAFFGLFQSSRIALCHELGSIEDVIEWLKSMFLRIERIAAAADASACSGKFRPGSSSLEHGRSGPSLGSHATKQRSLCLVGSVASESLQGSSCSRPEYCLEGAVNRDISLLSGYIIMTLLVLGCKPAKIEAWLEQNAECFSPRLTYRDHALDVQAYPMAVQASAGAAAAAGDQGYHISVDAGSLTGPSAFVLSDAAIGIDEAVIEKMTKQHLEARVQLKGGLL